MSDCLEMLIRVLGFRIVWLGGKYEKMKSVILKCFYRNYFKALTVLDLFFNRAVKSYFLVLLSLKLSILYSGSYMQLLCLGFLSSSVAGQFLF